MPPSCYIVPFFIMFGGCTMGARGQFVLLSGLPVCFVHGVLLFVEAQSASQWM